MSVCHLKDHYFSLLTLCLFPMTGRSGHIQQGMLDHLDQNLPNRLQETQDMFQASQGLFRLYVLLDTFEYLDEI